MGKINPSHFFSLEFELNSWDFDFFHWGQKPQWTNKIPASCFKSEQNQSFLLKVPYKKKKETKFNIGNSSNFKFKF